jgi:hypothetical protein
MGELYIFSRRYDSPYTSLIGYGDPYTYPNRNPFNLKDTGFIKRNIEYDPATKQYYIIEKIGDHYYRTPMTFSMKEFMDLKGRKMKKNISKQEQAFSLILIAELINLSPIL